MNVDTASGLQGTPTNEELALPTQVKATWLDGSDMPPGSLFSDWLQSLQSDPVASVYLHPELALADAEHAGVVPAIYAKKNQDPMQASKLSTLAVLLPKVVRMYPVPGYPWGVSLKGYWLAGNQLLGRQNSQAINDFVRAAVNLLNSSDAQCIYFDDIDAGSNLWNRIDEAGRAGDAVVSHLHAPQIHWWIQFPADPEQYWQDVPSKTRRNLRSAARKFEHTVTCHTDKHDVPAMLEQMHQISLKTWQGKRLGRTVGVSKSWRQFWETIAGIGALRSYVLSHDGRPVAFLLASQFHGRMILEEQGYDSSLRAYSPGSVLYLRVLDDLIARNTPQLVDFGFGHADYKQWLCNKQTMTGPVVMARRNWRLASVIWLDGFRRRTAESIRSRLKNWQIMATLRRLYRR